MNTLQEVLNRYHGIDKEMEDTMRRPLSAKLDINTICRIDAVTEVLKEKRQDAIDLLVSIGFETLMDSDSVLNVELRQAFLKAAESETKGGE